MAVVDQQRHHQRCPIASTGVGRFAEECHWAADMAGVPPPIFEPEGDNFTFAVTDNLVFGLEYF